MEFEDLLAALQSIICRLVHVFIDQVRWSLKAEVRLQHFLFILKVGRNFHALAFGNQTARVFKG